MHRAAVHGTPTTIQTLLAAGASVSAQNGEGQTPLHKAASSPTAVNIQALVAAGADIMIQDDMWDTPLHIVAKCWWGCKPGVIQSLMTAGADIRTKNRDGATPWDLA